MLIMHVVMDINVLTLFDVDAVLFCERKIQWNTQVSLFKACLGLCMKPVTVSMLRMANFNSLFY